MTIIAIYGFHGKFLGDSDYEYVFPEIGASHKCMLFLRQATEIAMYEVAVAECGKFGFSEIDSMHFGMLQVEMINTDGYRQFSGFYEEALSEGSALVYYPND